MLKRIFVMSTEGIIDQFADSNPFETDLEIFAVKYPNWAYITYSVQIPGRAWHEVATIYRNTVAL